MKDDVLDAKRGQILLLFRATLPNYPVRWADDRTTLGDFEGREFALEIFNVPVEQQRSLYQHSRDLRKSSREILGSPILLIFHTPEATREHYAHLFNVFAISRNFFTSTITLSTALSTAA